MTPDPQLSELAQQQQEADTWGAVQSGSRGRPPCRRRTGGGPGPSGPGWTRLIGGAGLGLDPPSPLGSAATHSGVDQLLLGVSGPQPAKCVAASSYVPAL